MHTRKSVNGRCLPLTLTYTLNPPLIVASLYQYLLHNDNVSKAGSGKKSKKTKRAQKHRLPRSTCVTKRSSGPQTGSQAMSQQEHARFNTHPWPAETTAMQVRAPGTNTGKSGGKQPDCAHTKHPPSQLV